jgi:NADPH2:quinone reductase
MKAVVIHATGGPEQLTLADMPDPVPGPGEVLIDVAYAGCNWADTQVRLPDGQWHHVLADMTIEGGAVDLEALFGAFPVALLERQDTR